MQNLLSPGRLKEPIGGLQRDYSGIMRTVGARGGSTGGSTKPKGVDAATENAGARDAAAGDAAAEDVVNA